jgi:hypothetical protein
MSRSPDSHRESTESDRPEGAVERRDELVRLGLLKTNGGLSSRMFRCASGYAGKPQALRRQA